MKKLLFLVLILAVAAVWWMKRHQVRPANNRPTELVKPIDLNEKVRRLPPHLQRKVNSALEEAGRFGSGAADVHISEPRSQDGKVPKANGVLPHSSPEIQRKLDRLPPSTRRKAEQALVEAQQNRAQP